MAEPSTLAPMSAHRKSQLSYKPLTTAYLPASSIDPFVTATTPVSARSELSPTAEVFTPRQSIDSYYAAASAASNASSQTVMGGYPAGHGRVSSLVATSVPEARTYTPGFSQEFGAVGDSINDIIGMMRTTTLGLPDPGDLPFRDACQREGNFTNEEPITRAFMITNIPTNTPFGFIAQQLNVRLPLPCSVIN